MLELLFFPGPRDTARLVPPGPTAAPFAHKISPLPLLLLSFFFPIPLPLHTPSFQNGLRKALRSARMWLFSASLLVFAANTFIRTTVAPSLSWSLPSTTTWSLRLSTLLPSLTLPPALSTALFSPLARSPVSLAPMASPSPRLSPSTSTVRVNKLYIRFKQLFVASLPHYSFMMKYFQLLVIPVRTITVERKHF